MNDTFTVALACFTAPRRSAVEYPSCMSPVRVICCGGKPGPGIVRIPEIAAPTDGEFQRTYGVERYKPKERFSEISEAKRVIAHRRGGKQKRRNRSHDHA